MAPEKEEKMKKFLVILLAVALVLAMAACGNGGEEVFGIAGALDFIGAVAIDHIKGIGHHTLNGLTL